MELTEYVEVAEGNVKAANAYLEHGYELLAVQSITRINENGPQRRTVYVLGRKPLTPHYDYKPKIAQPETGMAAGEASATRAS